MIEAKEKQRKAYSELQNDLRGKILRNELSCETAIAPETELAAQFGISRNTARKAFQNLVEEGLLERIQGRGTFIVPPERRKTESSQLCMYMAMPDYNLTQSKNDYDRGLISGVLEYCFHNDARMKKCIDHEDVKVDKYIALYKQQELSGIIWERPMSRFFPVIEKIHMAGIPQVTISRSIPGIPSIFFDVESSLRQTLAFLHGIGHKKIVYLDLPREEPIFKLRQKAFIDEQRKRGVVDAEKYLCLLQFEAHQFLKHYDMLPECTAIIAGSMYIEYLLAWCAERGFSIPGDITVISQTSENASDIKSHPEISGIIDPRREIGVKAAELISKQANNTLESTAPIKIRGELIVRDSCVSPREMALV